jgi:hypothetical protein
LLAPAEVGRGAGWRAGPVRGRARCGGGCGWCAMTGAWGACGLGRNGAGARAAGGGGRAGGGGAGAGLITVGGLTAGASGLAAAAVRWLLRWLLRCGGCCGGAAAARPPRSLLLRWSCGLHASSSGGVWELPGKTDGEPSVWQGASVLLSRRMRQRTARLQARKAGCGPGGRLGRAARSPRRALGPSAAAAGYRMSCSSAWRRQGGGRSTERSGSADLVTSDVAAPVRLRLCSGMAGLPPEAQRPHAVRSDPGRLSVAGCSGAARPRAAELWLKRADGARAVARRQPLWLALAQPFPDVPATTASSHTGDCTERSLGKGSGAARGRGRSGG